MGPVFDSAQPSTERDMSDASSAPESSAGYEEVVEGAFVPRPRPGFKSRGTSQGVAGASKVALLAALLKSGVGLTCLSAAVLYMPIHMVTPIFSGVSCIMIVTGTHSIWRLGIDVPGLRRPTRLLTWLIPGLAVLIFLLMWVLGPGALGPDWDAPLPAEFDGTVRFQSAP